MCHLKGRQCQLVVHLERGFTLLEGGLGPPAKVIWSYQFDKLKSSADDGNRMLFLDFVGCDGEIVSLNNFFQLKPKKRYFTYE